MDKKEALAVLERQLAEYRKLSYAELAARIEKDEQFEVTGPSGIEYQIESVKQRIAVRRVPNKQMVVADLLDRNVAMRVSKAEVDDQRFPVAEIPIPVCCFHPPKSRLSSLDR